MTFSVMLHEVLVFLAIFLRVGVAISMLPFFRAAEIPASFKALMAFFVTLLLFVPLSSHIPPLPSEPVHLGMVVLGEMLFGVVFVFTLLTVLSAFEVAGDIISFQMGFGFAQVADPLTGIQITIVSRFFQLLATLIFFAMNGHHILITVLYRSFETVPIGSALLMVQHTTASQIVSTSVLVFTLAFKVAAPIMLVLFLTEVGMGLIVKFAPQINILVVGFAVTIIVGIIFAALAIEAWGRAMERAFHEAFSVMARMLIPRQ